MAVHFEIDIPDGVRATVHRPGARLLGKVTLTLAKELRIQRLRLQLIAEETAHVRETRKSAPIHLTSKERLQFLLVSGLVWGTWDDTPSRDWEVIPPGTHQFHFELTFPEVNYPPTLNRPNIARVVYSLQACLERPRKSNPLTFSQPIELLFQPVYRVAPSRRTIPIAQIATPEEDDSDDHGDATNDFMSSSAFVTGTISSGTVCQGEVTTAAVHAQTQCDRLIKRITCALVERVECHVRIRGQDRTAFYDTVVKQIDPELPCSNPEKAGSLAADAAFPKPAETQKASFVIRMPWELNPTTTKQLTIQYLLQFRIEFDQPFRLPTITAKRPPAILHVPLRVAHEKTELPNFPSYHEAGAVPTIDIKLWTDFMPWDPTNPHWPTKRRGGNSSSPDTNEPTAPAGATLDPTKVPDVDTPPDHPATASHSLAAKTHRLWAKFRPASSNPSSSSASGATPPSSAPSSSSSSPRPAAAKLPLSLPARRGSGAATAIHTSLSHQPPLPPRRPSQPTPSYLFSFRSGGMEKPIANHR
ncbi:hypothetical protein H4R34_001176 [Dimargaris verticillata]|uniref:Arrestin C-terminal-like domain-containing protein n=1 Tax=Dimargaris verticillata TaxID=2761393 RepID=A0A9W8B424_9FUNG|nr:hypothetical protein H4R34_001176 [Dimargaris verticillata]